jgi:uroporphyrinogen-III synthase
MRENDLGKSMKDKVVAILESRIHEQIAELIAKYGGIPFSAPALAEIPDVDIIEIEKLFKKWEKSSPDIFIFQTGVGAKGLFEAAKRLGRVPLLLEKLDDAVVIVRGPKPTAVLRSFRVRVDAMADEPYTSAEVLAKLGEKKLKGKKIIIQRYGESNVELKNTLEFKGAQVFEIATYRWALPKDIEPLIRFMNALKRYEIDLVAFTSASQVNNLFKLAQQVGEHELLKKNLNQTKIASIGPVCTTAIKKYGIKVDVEADPPKLGAFVVAINKVLS